MFYSVKRRCKKVALLLICFALIPFPKPLSVPTASHECHPDPRANEVDKQKQSEFVLFLLNPQSIGYILLFMGLAVVTLLTITDILLKSVFVICSLGVYCATYHCRLHSNQSGNPQITR